MSKVKLTKGELKKQRDSLKQFEHFLPILQLKKLKLQLEIQLARERLRLKILQIDALEGEIKDWAGLLQEERDLVARWIKPKEIITKSFNITGVDIPIFERVLFEEPEYDLFLTPLWLDIAIEKIRRLVVFFQEKKVFRTQLLLLENELRITAQRVNLFEKIKIPEARENIRLIRIYLGDQQRDAVGRSKIAKKKIGVLV